MKDLVIFGAGGFGREVLAYCEDVGFPVAGFADDNPAATDGFDLPVGVLGPASSLQVANFDWIIALGDPGLRRRVHRELAGAGATFRTLVHPTAYVARSASVADGCVVCPFAFVSTHTNVGANVALNTYVSVGHDARVGAHTVLSPYAVLNGNVELGDAVFLGTGAVVTPGVTVGADSKITVLTAASRDVEPGSLVAGARPKARVMFQVEPS